jgi:transposase
MIHLASHSRVFLALGGTDMRKSINALSMLVEGVLQLDPFSGHLFVFCNRRHTMLKILCWDRNGFCLFIKRLEKHHFHWPKSKDELLEVGTRELGFLLEGLDICSINAHGTLTYSTMI